MAGLTEGKAALITGAANGIGRATALLFAREGASVICGDIDETSGAETVDLVRKAGGKAEFIRGDVSQEADIQAMVDASETLRQLACIDVKLCLLA
ncbi:MAG: SDR family NAD(P)-dependent oxidoreductase [Pseudomonadota bacterium]